MVARNQVDVQVHDSLAGGRAVVDADVVGVTVEFCVERRAGFGEQGLEGAGFVGGEVGKRGDVPAGNDQRVAGEDGIAVPQG